MKIQLIKYKDGKGGLWLKLELKLLSILCDVLELDNSNIEERYDEIIKLVNSHQLESISVIQYLSMVEDEFDVEFDDEVLLSLENNLIDDVKLFIENQGKFRETV